MTEPPKKPFRGLGRGLDALMPARVPVTAERPAAATAKYEGNVFNPNWQGCPPEAMNKLGVSHALMDTRIPPDQPTG